MKPPEYKRKIVYLIRHGQSIDNAAPVFQGFTSPLSPKGLEQAGQIAQRLAESSIEVVISSPLPRAKQTAEAIAKMNGRRIETSDLFVERIKPSALAGKAWDDLEATTLWREWDASLYTPGLRVRDGENYDDILARVDKALAYLNARPESSMAVVSHGYFLRSIVARVLLGTHQTGDLMKRIQRLASVDNTGITVIEYKDAFEEDFCWRLRTYNDYAHFTD